MEELSCPEEDREELRRFAHVLRAIRSKSSLTEEMKQWLEGVKTEREAPDGNRGEAFG
jgi:hypothetical protein